MPLRSSCSCCNVFASNVGTGFGGTTLRLARTIADLEGSTGVLRRHIAEALIYRRATLGAEADFDRRTANAHRSPFALREAGFETVMVNSNPETVSTDYDTSDRLYFEPLTLEDVLEIYRQEKCNGAIVQYGGQTPLNLSLIHI